MDAGLHLDWQFHKKGYEVVEIDPHVVDWTALAAEPYELPEADKDIMSGAAWRAVHKWGMRLGPPFVDDGCEGPLRIIEPIVPSPRLFSPLSQQRHLYLTLANTEPTDDGLLAFAGQFGVLDHDHPQHVGAWIAEIGRLKAAVEAMVANGNGDPGSFVEIFAAHAPFQSDAFLATVLEVGPDGRPQVKLKVNSLRNGMWLQLAFAAAETRFIRCSECLATIAVGPDAAHAHKTVCSNRCRVRRSRRRMRERESEFKVSQETRETS